MVKSTIPRNDWFTFGVTTEGLSSSKATGNGINKLGEFSPTTKFIRHGGKCRKNKKRTKIRSSIKWANKDKIIMAFEAKLKYLHISPRKLD